MLGRLQNYIQRKIALFRRYADKNTVFIYQMGKVGSTTLENSMSNAVHLHAFYSKNSTCLIRFKGLNKFGFKSVFYTVEHELTLFILRWIFKRRQETKVITLVREPITRNQSMYFHDLDAYLFSAHTNCLSSRRVPLPTRSQPKRLLEQVFNEEFDHYYPLNWFDNEFKPMTSIDIYSVPFNKEQGFSLIEHQRLSVLCIRTDKLDQLIPIVERFIGRELTIVKDNSAADKWYADIYNDFKQHYTLPMTIEKNIKKSQFYQHFFS